MTGLLADIAAPLKNRIKANTNKEFIYPEKNEHELYIKQEIVIKYFLLYFSAAIAQSNPATA
jgi:hypothetical protein